MKLAIIVGTRPEIIKMSPIIRECERLKLDYFILHTGQHYSYNMDRVFFDQLELPGARYNLDVGSGSHATQTGDILIDVEKVLLKEQPDVILVEGDTNTVLAGALAATKLHIKVGHVEAGLRSYDRMMPEEINRVLTDHCSDLLFAPTEQSQRILLGEGIPKDKIFVTGNTVVDAVQQNLKLAEKKAMILTDLNLEKQGYFLVTTHRQENVDNEKRFGGILEGLQLTHNAFDLPVVYPIHPRADKQMHAFGLESKGVTLIEPLDYLSFLTLEQHAKAVFTDSGGVQEEACILQVPCVTMRDSTERPETLDVGGNILTGVDKDTIFQGVKTMMTAKRNWKNPFGDGTAGRTIVSIVTEMKA